MCGGVKPRELNHPRGLSFCEILSSTRLATDVGMATGTQPSILDDGQQEGRNDVDRISRLSAETIVFHSDNGASASVLRCWPRPSS